jgi:hypothetical protein
LKNTCYNNVPIDNLFIIIIVHDFMGSRVVTFATFFL